jgi:hypothetical protein
MRNCWIPHCIDNLTVCDMSIYYASVMVHTVHYLRSIWFKKVSRVSFRRVLTWLVDFRLTDFYFLILIQYNEMNHLKTGLQPTLETQYILYIGLPLRQWTACNINCVQNIFDCTSSWESDVDYRGSSIKWLHCIFNMSWETKSPYRRSRSIHRTFRP